MEMETASSGECEMIMFMIGFFSGSYLSVFFVFLMITSHVEFDKPLIRRLWESLLWPYHLLALMFGKDEEE